VRALPPFFATWTKLLRGHVLPSVIGKKIDWKHHPLAVFLHAANPHFKPANSSGQWQVLHKR
jgi:hypothetical protein